MKNAIFRRLIIFIGAISATGCSENLAEGTKGETPLALSASTNEIVLDERDYAQTAITLNWTTGTNHGTGNAIDYTLEIVPDGTDYAEGYTLELGRRVYTQSYTTQRLNELLTDKFGAESGVAALYHARITARIADDTRIQTSEVSFTATTYEPVTQTLYLIGDAAPNGWSADNATPLKRTQPGVFTWTGALNAGEFKFITTLGAFLPSYNRDATASDGNAIVYRSEDDDPDEKFSVAQAGGYTVKADLLNGKLTLAPAEINTPPYNQIYFVSEANSWEFILMTQDPANPFVFRYGAEIGNGQFKFGTSQGSWENMYKTDYDNADYTHTTVVFVSGYDPDNKWLLFEETPNKPYKIALDITPDKESMTMTEFTPYTQIWLIGDAAPGGWSLDNATAMDKGDDDYTFTWTGRLNDGELKFTCDCDSSWNGAWFMAGENDKPLEAGSEAISFVDKRLAENGSIDRKWTVTAGNYTLTLNQLTETLTVTRH